MEESVLCGGVLLRLTDTAGMRETADLVEQKGVERSRRAMEAADLILLVSDSSIEMGPENESHWKAVRSLLQEVAGTGKPWIYVQSKCDLSGLWAGSLGIIGQGNVPASTVCLSTLTGQGMDVLERAVADLFPGGDPGEAGSFLTDQRQEEAARRCYAALRQALGALETGLTPDAALSDVEEALDALGELTGRTAKEEIVSRIFSRFCVGK